MYFTVKYQISRGVHYLKCAEYDHISPPSTTHCLDNKHTTGQK